MQNERPSLFRQGFRWLARRLGQNPESAYPSAKACHEATLGAVNSHVKVQIIANALRKHDCLACLRWRKPGTLQSDASNACRIVLDLPSYGGQGPACMIIHRAYNKHPLRLDRNLLTNEFPAALTAALDRAHLRVRRSKGPSQSEQESIKPKIAEAS